MTRRICLLAATWLLVTVPGAWAWEARPSDGPAVAIGDAVAEFTFKDLRFLERSLADLGPKQAYVFVFTTLDCPVVNRYLPRLKELDEAYRDRGVQFVAINVGPQDTIREAAYQAIKADCAFPFCKDFDGVVVRALGVSRTPEVAILDGQHKLRYRGRIDSQYRTGGVQPTPGREDLKAALEDILANREVAVAETPVDGCKITPARTPKFDFPVTYAEHVAPILQKHCQDCHHPGSTGPFALLSLDDAAGHADMIAEVVREQRMPPVYASDEQGHEIINRLMLTDEERNLVWAWCRGEQAPGDLTKQPAPRAFRDDRWEIDQPELVTTMKKPVKLPAQGILPYKYIFLPHKFEHDTWVQGVQILPSNTAAMHHCNLACLPPGGGYNDADFITGYVPGGTALTTNANEAFLIPKGSVLVLQCHYVTTGQECEDQTSVGFKFAKGLIQHRLRHFRVTTGDFAIAAGSGHYPVSSVRTLEHASTGVGMFSHMHLRGKDMVFTALYPDGQRETLLAIPNYSFDWQMGYRWTPGQKKFPAGTKIEVVAHYDNSPFNPYNPDASAVVKEGDQTFDEMMFGFFFFTEDDEQLNLTVDPSTGVGTPAPAADEQAATTGG